MNHHVQAGYLNAKNLNQLVDTLTLPNMFYLLEEITDLHLGCFPNSSSVIWPVPGTTATQFRTGRIFNSTTELRWKQIIREDNDKFSFKVRLITEHDEIASKAIALQWHKPRRAVPEIQPGPIKEYFLWGEIVDDDTDSKQQWYENEVPRFFPYPVSVESKWVKILIQHYLIKFEAENPSYNSASVQINRFLGFIPGV